MKIFLNYLFTFLCLYVIIYIDNIIILYKQERMAKMIYITYMKNGFGPYQIRFECEYEAVQWIKANEIEITNIDFIGG